MVNQTLSGEAAVALPMTTLLKRALLVDAIACSASVILLLGAAGWLSSYLGLPVALLVGAGLVLIPFVALLAFTVSRPRPPALLVGLVIGFNLAWMVASIGLLVAGVVAPTTLGLVVVAGQAVAVLGLAVLQYLGWQRQA
jgi:hypothetical protein